MPGQDYESPRTSLSRSLPRAEVTLDLAVPDHDERGMRTGAAQLQSAHPRGATEGQRLRLAGQGARA